MMKGLSRRDSLKAIFGGVGAAAKTSLFGAGIGSGLLSQLAQAGVAPASLGGPKRVVFFLQNQGFDPRTCLPSKMALNNGSLAGAVLPDPIKALDPFKEKLHIIEVVVETRVELRSIMILASYSLKHCCLIFALGWTL